MKREITVSYGRTINTGNYESSRIHMGYTRELEEGEDKKKAIKKEFVELKKMVEQEE